MSIAVYPLAWVELKKGARLGPYEILAPLGAGGMGEVYAARDTRLGRKVAIKLLPAIGSSDDKSRLRFQREAKAISALNHPHICPLYDVGEIAATENVFGGSRFYLVMQYLEGETLADKLTRGAIPLDQLLRYGIEVADALDSAHRQHLLHRDLKPGNIMIIRSGAVLLDFGLAKFVDQSAAPVPDSIVAERSTTTETRQRVRSSSITAQKPLTAEGALVGTLDYMAPEQVEGRAPDVRTDIFSLGACLYEMVTGRRPFTGQNRASVIGAILQCDPPPIRQLQPHIPESVDWVIRACLAKEPDDRMQTAHDVMLELRRIRDTEQVRTTTARAQRHELPWRSIGIAVFMAIALSAIGLFLWKAKTAAPAPVAVKRLSIVLPESAPLFAPGYVVRFAVSNDGSRVVYTGGATGPAQLYLYEVATGRTVPLAQTEGARSPFFSPDGEWIAFQTADGALKKISAAGGAPVTIDTGREIRGATWGANDTIVFAERWPPLRKISAAGGRPQPLITEKAGTNVRWPVFLPGGDDVLYTIGDNSGDYENANLAVLSLADGKSRIVLHRGTYGRYVPPGYLVYLHSKSLFAVRFDPRSLTVTGSPVPIISDVDLYYGSGLAHFDVAGDGSLFYIPRDPAESDAELVWVGRDGTATALSATRRGFDDPHLSPDGTQLLVSVGPDPAEIWVYDIGRGTWSRVVSGGMNTSPMWSRDGKQIIYSSNREGEFNVYLIPADGSAPSRQLTHSTNWPFPTSSTPDGNVIAAVEQHRETNDDIALVDAGGSNDTQPFLASRFNESAAAFSPDGRWVVYESDESGHYEVYVQSYPRPGHKWLVSITGGRFPLWRRDGRELFYRNGSDMMSVAVAAEGDDFRTSRPRLLFRGDFGDHYDVTADGQRFVMIRRKEPPPRQQINVVMGLFDARMQQSR